MIKKRPSKAQLIDLALQLAGTSQTKLLRKLFYVFGDIVIPTIKKEKETDFMYAAARNENPETLQYLKFMGFDINAKNDSYWTPLHLASFNGMGRAVCTLLCHGADPKKRSKVNKNIPRAIAKRPDIEAVFDEFDKLTREEFIEKYGVKVAPCQEAKKDQIELDSQDAIQDIFPILDLPLEIVCEIYNRVPLLVAHRMQLLVCKQWRYELQGRFQTRFPYLETEWEVARTGSLVCQALPTAIHFLGHNPLATKQDFRYLASLYDKYNRELERAAAADKIVHVGERDVTKKFDPKEFKQFFFGLLRKAEIIYARKFEFNLVVVVTDVHENYGVAFDFKSVLAPKK